MSLQQMFGTSQPPFRTGFLFSCFLNVCYLACVWPTYPETWRSFVYFDMLFLVVAVIWRGW